MNNVSRETCYCNQAQYVVVDKESNHHKSDAYYLDQYTHAIYTYCHQETLELTGKKKYNTKKYLIGQCAFPGDPP